MLRRLPLLLAICVGQAVIAAAESVPDQYSIPFNDSALTLDGILDEPCYQQVSPFEKFVVAAAPNRTPPATQVWLFWSHDALNFAYRCEDRIPVGRKRSDVENINGQDRVEVFIWDGNPDSTYYCIEIGVEGDKSDYAARFYRQMDKPWEPHPGWKYQTRRTKTGYIVEASLPKAAIHAMGQELAPGHQFRLGLFRADYDELDGSPTWITWIDHGRKPDFHVADSFGGAQLVPPISASTIDLTATDRFGGLLAIKSEATGFFRVEQINGRWMFITPEGHGYLALGANHTGRYLTEQAQEMGLMDRFDGDRTAAAEFLRRAMVDMGLNAGEAYAPIAPELKPQLPWVVNLTFPTQSKFAFDVFDPATLKAIAETFREQCAEIRNDPMVLGIACADLPVWGQRRIDYYAGLPTDSPGGRELARFRAAGKSDNEFMGHVAATQYRHMHRVVREAAPNHLFIGERFRLRGAPDEVIRAVGPYVDVFPTQSLILSPQRPPEWQEFQRPGYDHEHELTGGKPMMIIDWAAPFSLAENFTHERGEIRNEIRASREAATFLRLAMARPYMIGVFKCQFIGLHGADRQFEGKSRRTYLQDDGDIWIHRTAITRDAHEKVLTTEYQHVLDK